MPACGPFLQNSKGQSISEYLFDVLYFPEKQLKIWQMSALESKKWSNHKIKAQYNVFDTNYVCANYIKYNKKVP